MKRMFWFGVRLLLAASWIVGTFIAGSVTDEDTPIEIVGLGGGFLLGLITSRWWVLAAPWLVWVIALVRLGLSDNPCGSGPCEDDWPTIAFVAYIAFTALIGDAVIASGIGLRRLRR